MVLAGATVSRGAALIAIRAPWRSVPAKAEGKSRPARHQWSISLRKVARGTEDQAGFRPILRYFPSPVFLIVPDRLHLARAMLRV